MKLLVFTVSTISHIKMAQVIEVLLQKNRPLYLHICWLNFDELAQENACKPHKGTDKLLWTWRGSIS